MSWTFNLWKLHLGEAHIDHVVGKMATGLFALKQIKNAVT